MTAKTQAPVRTETKPLNVDRSGILQRKCDCGKSASLTGQCSECNAKNLLQRRSTNSTEVAEVPPIVHEVLRSPGQALDSDTRTLMESRFGHDFSQVRVHTNNQAAQSAQSVNALAYTVGKNVVFGSGQYAPQTTAGKKVLAHELTHVLQQGSMSETIAPLRVGGSNDFYEQEAEAQAEKVVSTNEPIATPTQRHTSAVQRLGDLTKVPAGLSCPIATSGAPPATDSLLFANRGTALTPLQRMQIKNFVSNRRAAGASTPVRVDGFASQVGPDDLNWRLSCDRVNAVANELISPSDGNPGIPSEFIEIFAQGETSEFGSDAENRRVNIFMPSGVQPSSNECTGLNVVPGSSTPAIISSRGRCGAGDDFDSHDFPTLSTGLNLLVAPLRLLSNSSLESNMDRELRLFAGAMGTTLASHFHSGSGSPVTHNPGDPLSVEVDASPTFNNMVTAATDEISRQIAAQALACNVDWTRFNLSPTATTLPGLNFNIPNGDTLQLQAVLGGTQGLTIAISNFQIPPGTNTFSATLRFEICDDFGVDETDVDPTNLGHGSPGLRSFWVLQHERPPGHVAFINTVVVNEPISGTF